MNHVPFLQNASFITVDKKKKEIGYGLMEIVEIPSIRKQKVGRDLSAVLLHRVYQDSDSMWQQESISSGFR